MADGRMCSKCKEKAPVNGQTYCRECRNKYQQDYEAEQAAMIGARNFQAGANAIRFALAQQMARAPGSTFEGRALAEWIMGFPAPEYSTAGNAAFVALRIVTDAGPLADQRGNARGIQ